MGLENGLLLLSKVSLVEFKQHNQDLLARQSLMKITNIGTMNNKHLCSVLENKE